MPSIPSTSCAGGASSPDEVLAKYRALLLPHVGGFDHFIKTGLQRAVKDVGSRTVALEDKEGRIRTLRMWYSGVRIAKPWDYSRNEPLLPSHARELGIDYSGSIKGVLNYSLDGGDAKQMERSFGQMPCMVGSVLCHTRGCSAKELVAMKEEEREFGGCFIVSGIERCIRLLQVQRCNVPLALARSAFCSRGPSYSDKGVSFRAKRHNHDCSTITNTLHYLNSGGVTLRFSLRKQEFMLPIVAVLRALTGSMDADIYSSVCRDSSDAWLQDRLRLLLHDAKQIGLYGKEECLAYIGMRFRHIVGAQKESTDVQIGKRIMDDFIIISEKSHKCKAEVLLVCLRKLYRFVGGRCSGDNPDSLQNLELLLPGHLICAFVKEKFEDQLVSMKRGIAKEFNISQAKVLSSLSSPKFMARVSDRYGGSSVSTNIGNKVGMFLSTGNVVSTSGLDLMQVSGYTIVAERLNFLRYISHYRSVHRGQFFTTMKTTTVRKLLPDSWGFLCPVHTPDGGPCGLLNHLAVKCETQCEPMEKAKVEKVERTLVELGVVPGEDNALPSNYLDVCLDGRVIGGASAKDCKRIVEGLRRLKVCNDIDNTVECALFPQQEGGPFPGLFIYTGMARFLRPVLHRESNKVEFIGPMEQPFMEIACTKTDMRDDITHIEIDPNNLFSLIASCTPFSDYNQSPRNMYQCQMGKQTMGTPAHSLPHRTDNKMYRIQNPQAPLVQTSRQAEFAMDDYPNGTNAVVAVLSYTGFDMEDAMILNKSSYERGFGHASVYKSKVIDLKEEAKRMGSSESRLRFSNVKSSVASRAGRGRGDDDEERAIDESLGPDGLPYVGQWVNEGDALYSYVDDLTGVSKIGKHKESEQACIQTVRLLGSAPKFGGGAASSILALRGSALQCASLVTR